MAETSFPWDGYTLGDAQLAPYTASFVSDVFETMFTVNPRYQGIVSTPELPGTITTSPAGVTIGPCVVMVRGRLYRNTGTTLSVVVPPSGQRNYYTIVARLTYGSKTVRFAVIGPSSTAAPDPVINDYYYDVMIAKVACDTTLGAYGILLLSGPINSISVGGHGRVLFRGHRGGDADQWATPGTTTYDVSTNQTRCMFGSVRWTGSAQSGNVAVTFPHAFSGTPIVLGSWYAGSNEAYEYVDGRLIVSVHSILTTGATFYWRSTAYKTRVGIHWVAIGPGVNIS